MNNFNYVVISIGTAVLLVSFILAFMLRKKKGLPGYFKFFYWIPLIRLLISINSFLYLLFTAYGNTASSFFKNIFYLALFCFSSLFFYEIFKKKGISRVIKITFLIIVAMIFFLLLINDFRYGLYNLYAVINFMIFIFCIYYFYNFFDSKQTFNLLNDSTFWIVNGFFLYACIDLPLFAILYYVVKINKNLGYNLLAVINIVIIIKHLFFIKAYRCAAKSGVEG
jgi:hypothetical protein